MTGARNMKEMNTGYKCSLDSASVAVLCSHVYSIFYIHYNFCELNLNNILDVSYLFVVIQRSLAKTVQRADLCFDMTVGRWCPVNL